MRRARRAPSPRRRGSRCPAGGCWCLDLRDHQEDWVRAKLGDRTLGFNDEELKRMMIAAGLCDAKVSVGARKAGDPFTVLIASGTKRASATNTRKTVTNVRGNTRRSRTSMSADVLTTLHALVAKRILVLDGAMGTMIQRHTLTEAEFRGDRFAGHPHDVKGNNDLLVLTRPDVVVRHPPRSTSTAGSDIIETNTFQQHRAIAQADYGLEPYVYELNVEAGRLAKAAAVEWTLGRPRSRGSSPGSMGPTNRILSISPDVNNPAFRAITFDELRDAYEDQVRGLVDGGCDLLLARDHRRHLERQSRHRRDRGGLRGRRASGCR